MIPGVNIDMGGAPKPIAPPSSLMQSQPPSNIPVGGLIKQMSNVGNTSQSSTISDVIIQNYGQAMTGSEFSEQMQMAAG